MLRILFVFCLFFFVLRIQATNSHLMEPLERFMRSPAARLKLHVGFAQTSKRMTLSKDAANSLKAELLTNTSRQNAFLMDNYKVGHQSLRENSTFSSHK